MGDARVTRLGYANARAKLRPFGIRQHDRFSHIHILGKTGTGKSTLLKQMVLQDVASGEGSVILIDPHGDLARDVRDAAGTDNVTYLDASRPRFTFNPLAGVSKPQQPLAVASLVSVFARQWEDSWGPRVEHLLRNALYVLVAQDDATLEDLPRLLASPRVQKAMLKQVANPPVRAFFEREWPSYSLPFKSAMKAPLLNKVGAILSDPRLRSIFCGDGERLRLAPLMAEGGVLLVDLSKGGLGEGPANVLGSVLLAYVALSGLARSTSEPVFVFVDELGSVASSFVASMLEELRKRRVALTVAHQHLSQLGPELSDAVLGNAGTRIAFRLGSKDSGVMAREFAPVFDPEDFLNLPNFEYYTRLLIDGQPSRAFSATTALPSGFHRT